jgi:hypothetical protein
MFKYHLNDEDLNEIELVMESGEAFEFFENDLVSVRHNKRKRERKQIDKKD